MLKLKTNKNVVDVILDKIDSSTEVLYLENKLYSQVKKDIIKHLIYPKEYYTIKSLTQRLKLIKESGIIFYGPYGVVKLYPRDGRNEY